MKNYLIKKSLNIQYLEAAGIIKDGKVVSLADEVVQDINHSEGPTTTNPIKPVKPIEPPVKEPDKGIVIYVVKKGDYLIKIAKLYGVNYHYIAIDNNIKNLNLIFPNQELKIVLPKDNKKHSLFGL